MQRVLCHKRIHQYLEATGLRVSPPYSPTEWNYWHIFEDGVIKPITADELLGRCLEWEKEHHVSPAEESAAAHFYPIPSGLRQEIERLKQILAAHGREFVTNQGVPKARLRRLEQRLGYQLDPDLAAFYAMTDGSPENDEWFAVGIQNYVPVCFLCLDEVLHGWEMAVENDEDDRKYWERVERLGNLTRDPKIALSSIFSPHWWRFAGEDFPVVMVDMQPSPSEKPGQIIAYFHDPDALICVADNFLQFFHKSNNLLEIRWDSIFPEESLDP